MATKQDCKPKSDPSMAFSTGLVCGAFITIVVIAVVSGTLKIFGVA